MDQSLLSKRYAKAIFSLCEGSVRRSARVAREFNLFKSLCKSGLWEVIINPLFKPIEKRRVLERFLKEHEFLEITSNFLLLLLKKHRFELFPDIHRLFTEFFDEMIERIVVTVICAEPLPTAIAMEYRKNIQLVVGHSALLRQVIDPELVGGVKIIIKNRMIDGTLLQQLEQFREHMGIYRDI